MEEKVNNQQNSSSNKAIIIVLVLVILGLLGFIVYDKFLQKDTKPETNTQEKDCNCPKCEQCQKCEECPKCTNNSTTTTSNYGEKITSLKKFELTDENQEIKIGKTTYKVRDNNGVLYINDENPLSNDEYYAQYVYLTDKFAIFTNNAQNKEYIGFALSETGRITINDDDSQMDNFRIVDGYLHATGGTHYSNEYGEMEWKNEDLIIKFIDNTLIVTSFK